MFGFMDTASAIGEFEISVETERRASPRGVRVKSSIRKGVSAVTARVSVSLSGDPESMALKVRSPVAHANNIPNKRLVAAALVLRGP